MEVAHLWYRWILNVNFCIEKKRNIKNLFHALKNSRIYRYERNYGWIRKLYSKKWHKLNIFQCQKGLISKDYRSRIRSRPVQKVSEPTATGSSGQVGDLKQ